MRGLLVEPDDGRAPVIGEIATATESVDLMVYLLTDDRTVDALVESEKRGVEVRVILEQHPFGGFGNPEEVVQRLREAGADVKWGSREFSFSHVKTFVIDRSVALIMNLNVSRTSFESNREFGIITTIPLEVETAQAIFEADWLGEPVARLDSLVVSPINSRDVLAGLIDSALISLDVYAEVIRDDQMITRFQAAAARGVRVRILMSPDSDPVNQRILSELDSSGIEVRYLSVPYIHAKVVVVDNARAFIGSQNFTATSLDENREIGIVVNERPILDRLNAVFESDFAAGVGHTGYRQPVAFIV